MTLRLVPLLLAALVVLRSAGAEDPPQGAALLKTDILGVFAHPDDETGMAATIAHYALGQGKVVANVYATRGEGGGNMVGTQWGPALGLLREAELRDCLRLLGVRYCYFLDQTDFFYTESVGATGRKWDKEEASRKLVRLVRALRPEVIVTMNPAPNPGQHGHHRMAGVLATEAFAAAADPAHYPEQLSDEGLGVWQARKLFYSGAAGSHLTTITTTQPSAKGRIPVDIAGEALSQHRSQGFGGFARSPWLRRPQAFTLVKSVVPPAPDWTDLLAGLPAMEPVRPVELAPKPSPPSLAFIPRPAIATYLQWAEQQGIQHVAADVRPDLPVLAGENTVVLLKIDPAAQDSINNPPTFEVPDGWEATPSAPVRNPAPGVPLAIKVSVKAPVDALTDAALLARASGEGGQILAEARLHPVPLAVVPRLRRPPSLDGSEPGWDEAAILDIGTNRTWQGKTDSQADCSARVHIAHHNRQLYVRVDVSDDVVVSNIEPNDIRGHWRSDAVEICLDPAAGAEDTTGCLKIGIFPFDTTGRVRAARDADARQGPVESTAPGLRLASQRTTTGYRVHAAIPLELISGRGKPPRRLGFNVLVYDGDKPGAAMGENINECRLAWAPRAGVQGRPEDWGRIDLE